MRDHLLAHLDVCLDVFRTGQVLAAADDVADRGACFSQDRSDVLPRLARLVSEIGRDGAVLVEAGSSGDDDLVVALTRGHPDRVGVPANLVGEPAS